MSRGESESERRRYKRFRARKGGYVVLRPQLVKLGSIIDISKGGLSYCYVTEGDEPDGDLLDMFHVGTGFYLSKLPIKTVTDFEIESESVVEFCQMRRRCVEFGPLNSDHEVELEYFIWKLTEEGE